MNIKLLTEHPLEFLSFKGGFTGLSNLFMSKCHIVGYHMLRLISYVHTLQEELFKYGIQKHMTSVIHLQFWAYGSWDSLFPISMSPTANL